MSQTALGVIGAGRIGRMHAENLVHHIPEAEVRAVASPHLDEGWAQELGIPVRSTENSTVFGDPQIDAVVITAPSGLHSELICQAAAAGKHIFCEKPVGFEEGPIEAAIEAAKAAGVQLQVGFNRRFDPDVCALADAVRSGDIGELHGLRVINRDPSSPPIEFVKRSGGLFFDFAIHDFSNGALCVIDNSRQARYGYDQRFEAFGTGGNLVVDNTRPTIRESFLEDGVYTDLPPANFVTRYRDAFVAELAAFVKCVREKTDVAVSAEDALAAVRVARAAKLSSDENRPVQLDDAALTAGGANR
jgi:myo-inositol 2-dehydrogenase/D-chiro-inositol 1-dehydrogenase